MVKAHKKMWTVIEELLIKTTLRYHYYTHQNGQNKKQWHHQILAIWRNWITHTFLVGM